jgi:hypothetical protein
MRPSTDNSNPGEPLRQSDSDGARIPVPSDRLIHCAHNVLREIRELQACCHADALDYDEQLHLQFREIVERNLQEVFTGIQVFWSTREKPKSIEMPTVPRGKYPGSQVVNGIIFNLNRDYHAHRLLIALSQLSIGRSHIFSIRRARRDSDLPPIARLVCLRLQAGEAEAPSDATWSIDIPFDAGPLGEFCSELSELAQATPNSSRDNLAERIRNAIGAWTHYTNWPTDEFWSRLTEQDRTLAARFDWPALYREAVQHIALIALYKENNGFDAMTYVLAPTIQGELESSLVVYWPPSSGEGPLPLLSLLQMILGQNATAILATERKQLILGAAFRNIGHTMRNRCDSIGYYFRNHQPDWHRAYQDQLRSVATTPRKSTTPLTDEQRAYNRAWLAAHSVPDTFLALGLWAFPSPRQLFGDKDKAPRYLSYDSEPLDILHAVTEWRHLAACYRFDTKKERWYDVCLDIVPDDIETCRLAPVDHDPVQTKACRLKETVLCAIFYEILRNACQHGVAFTPSTSSQHDGSAYVELHCCADTHDGHEVLVLYNDADLTDRGKRDKWRRVDFTEALSDSGPGLVAAVLRTLDFGNIWVARYGEPDNCPTYAIAIWLKGMTIGRRRTEDSDG